MNPEHPQAEDGNEPRTAPLAAPVRFRTDIRGLMALVACCGLLLWIAMTLHEGLDPTRSEAAGLRSSSWTRRIEAAENLTVMVGRDDRVAILALAASTNDDVPSARLAILSALSAITADAIQNGQPENVVQAGVDGLLRAIVDPEPIARQAALNGLAGVAQTPGPHRIDRRPLAAPVAERLGDPEPSVRLAALNALMVCGYNGTEAPPLLIVTLEDPDAEVRAAALRALRGFPRDLDRFLPLLLRTVEDSDPRIQSACSWAFDPDRPAGFAPKVAPELISALGSQSPVVRQAAAAALSQLAIDPHATTNSVNKMAIDPHVVAAIPALLAVLKEPTIGRNGDSIGDPTDPVPVAAQALGRIAPETAKASETLDALVELAQSEERQRESAAIEAIGQYGPAAEPAVPFLIGRFRGKLARATRSNPYFYDELPRALAQIAPGTKSAGAAAAVLIEALEPDNRVHDYLRMKVVQALDAFGAEAAPALPRLRELQKSPDRQLQIAAETAILSIEQARNRSRGTSPDAGGQPEALGHPPG